MKKYRVHDDTIQAHEVIRETEKSIWYLQRVYHTREMIENRELKESNYHSWHDSWQEAKAHLVGKFEKAVMDLRHELAHAEVNLERVRAMKEE
jgi:hypothetical protein